MRFERILKICPTVTKHASETSQILEHRRTNLATVLHTNSYVTLG